MEEAVRRDGRGRDPAVAAGPGFPLARLEPFGERVLSPGTRLWRVHNASRSWLRCWDGAAASGGHVGPPAWPLNAAADGLLRPGGDGGAAGAAARGGWHGAGVAQRRPAALRPAAPADGGADRLGLSHRQQYAPGAAGAGGAVPRSGGQGCGQPSLAQGEDTAEGGLMRRTAHLPQGDGVQIDQPKAGPGRRADHIGQPGRCRLSWAGGPATMPQRSPGPRSPDRANPEMARRGSACRMFRA